MVWRRLFVFSGLVLWIVFVVGWVGTSSALAARGIRYLPKQGAAKALQAKDIAWRPATGTQAQTWIIWAWNDQGYLVTAFFISTRFLMVSRFGVQLTIRTPDGRVIHRVKEYTLDKLKARQDRLSMKINQQHSWRGGAKQGKVLVSFAKWACFLKYRRVLAGFRAAGGPMRFGSKVFEGIPFAPQLEVSGALRIDGKRVAFQGIGYADYSLQTIVPKRLARRWYAMRAMGKHYTVIASQLWTSNRWRPTSVPMLSIARDRKWLHHCGPANTSFRAIRIRRDKQSKHQIPMRVSYRCKAKDGTRYSVTITHQKQMGRLDLMSHINPVLRFVLQQLLSRPFVFRYRASVVLVVKPAKGKPHKERSSGYSEWLFVQ